jgi:hypothetical protein
LVLTVTLQQPGFRTLLDATMVGAFTPLSILCAIFDVNDFVKAFVVMWSYMDEDLDADKQTVDADYKFSRKALDKEDGLLAWSFAPLTQSIRMALLFTLFSCCAPALALAFAAVISLTTYVCCVNRFFRSIR